MHIRHYLAALELVNEERHRAKLPELDHLPAGIPRDPRRCAIANAMPGALVCGHEAPGALAIGPARRQLRRDVLHFIDAFDRNGGQGPVEPGVLVEGGIEDDKGCLVSA